MMDPHHAWQLIETISNELLDCTESSRGGSIQGEYAGYRVRITSVWLECGTHTWQAVFGDCEAILDFEYGGVRGSRHFWTKEPSAAMVMKLRLYQC